jgi:hypothetical protein
MASSGATQADVEAGSTLGWNTRDDGKDLVAAGCIATSRRCYVGRREAQWRKAEIRKGNLTMEESGVLI